MQEVGGWCQSSPAEQQQPHGAGIKPPLEQGLCLSECLKWTKSLSSSLERGFYVLSSGYPLLPPPSPQAGTSSAGSPMASSPRERAAPSPHTAVMPLYSLNHGVFGTETILHLEQTNLQPHAGAPLKPLSRRIWACDSCPMVLSCHSLLHRSQQLPSTCSLWAEWVFVALGNFFSHVILEFRYKHSNSGLTKRVLWQFSFTLFYNPKQRNAAEPRVQLPFKNLHTTQDTLNTNTFF